MWSVTDGWVFYRERPGGEDVVLRDVFSGEKLKRNDPESFRRSRSDIPERSNYKHLRAQESTQAEADVLAAGLRNLGYIELHDA